MPKIVSVDDQAGWLPYAAERMDHAYSHLTWAYDEEPLREKPSPYLRRNVFGCIFSDRHAIEQADKIGLDNLMFETDFPYGDGPYPNTIDHIRAQFDGIDPQVAYKILRGNAIRLFGLDLDRAAG